MLSLLALTLLGLGWALTPPVGASASNPLAPVARRACIAATNVGVQIMSRRDLSPVEFSGDRGSFTVGSNRSSLGGNREDKPAVEKRYAANVVETNQALTLIDLNNAALGKTVMGVLGKDEKKGFSYVLGTTAQVRALEVRQGGAAWAQGQDPQHIVEVGVLAVTLSIEPGSRLFELRPEVDQASTVFEFTAPLLSEPLLRVQLEPVEGRISATVRFAEDKRLRFVHPTTELPITAEDLEGMFEDLSGLGDEETGTTMPFPFVTFYYDLSKAELAGDDAVGFTIESMVDCPGLPEVVIEEKAKK